jgi:uncharacterized OB-fold protein
MSEYRKPLPVPSEVSAPYWAGLREGALRVQKCRECSRYLFYPRSVCPFCLSRALEWAEACGRGRLYSYTVVRRAMHPAFQEDVPYVYAIVELEEGVRVTTNVVNCPLEALRVDMPLRAVYDSVTPEVTLLKFEPA